MVRVRIAQLGGDGGPDSERIAAKQRQAARLHLSYLERDGVERDGTAGKLYATGGYTFSDIDDPYIGAGYQHKLGQNLYAKAEYRHQFIGNFSDFDTFAVGLGLAF